MPERDFKKDITRKTKTTKPAPTKPAEASANKKNTSAERVGKKVSPHAGETTKASSEASLPAARKRKAATSAQKIAIKKPAPARSTADGDLFFQSLADTYINNPRFLRRDWLAEELDKNLREPGKRFVLFTAEPGADKCAFMAQLAHDHREWLRYFIRRDHSACRAQENG